MIENLNKQYERKTNLDFRTYIVLCYWYWANSS